MQDYYTLLGLPRSATKAEIRSAYLILLKKYHPDYNPDAAAAQITVTLNEAYTVLSSDDKRKTYDAWLESEHQQDTQQRAEAKTQSEIPIKCSRCGRLDPSLRLSLMYYTMSFLVITSRRGSSGIWCERCRAVESAKWSLLSYIVDWWGIPWGPIYTIHALFRNSLGGLQP